MTALMLIDDYKTGCTHYEGFGCINDVHALIEEHATSKKQIIELHSKVMGSRLGDVFSYFVSAAGQNSLHETLRVERFFDPERAMCALDQDYWNRLIDVINVKNFMPAEKRNEWFDSLNEWRKADRYSLASVKPVPFNRETALSTAKSLLDERKDFFSEMVDGVFKNLSPHHYTNKSEGFSVRMIVDKAMPSVNSNYDKQEYINDLRKIIGLLFNREGAENVTSHQLFNDLQKYYGEWVSIDGDSIALKPHKSGTVHVQVSQEIADALNVVLAYRYPNVIPMKKARGNGRQKNTFSSDRTYSLLSEPLPFTVSDYFGEMARKGVKPKTHDGMPPRYEYSLPGTYLHSQSTNDDVARIYTMVGGVSKEDNAMTYLFDYDPAPVFEHLFINGTLPDQKSHQFYPTKNDIRKTALDMAEVQGHHTVIDPSAGFGDLIDSLPRNAATTTIEIHSLAAAVLRAKGFNTIHGDFLTQHPASVGLFDRVIMNPPYSEGRWVKHVTHALNFIKPGGKLVAVLPASAPQSTSMTNIGGGYDVSFSKEYPQAFEGTFVNVVIMVVDRHE
ncbi:MULTISPECIES: DUF4942 domain-containing protein [Providencia]|uniref:DUF4942 domain-containing protein n=1 Tax=Providencia huaxiensis TaxID=2027290 RepID=A0ABU2J305_9GAMM|nr:DUF4942 domain-containing protein [Providencia huaxiensis]MDT0135705.1 DUF4942 domain-containing protein [Providencia huaxiensis]MDT1982110.1 DUF4942 domain-containing protein [Providencia huaxiensis]